MARSTVPKQLCISKYVVICLLIEVVTLGCQALPAQEKIDNYPATKKFDEHKHGQTIDELELPHQSSSPLQHNSSKSSEICTSTECVYAANALLQNMDAEMNPCDDFYKFACGNYTKNKVVPADKPRISTFLDVMDNVNIQIRQMLTKNDSEGELRTFRLVKDFYNLCNNESLTSQQSLDDLRDVLDECGGWPVLLGDKWDGNSFTWYESSIKSNLVGYPPYSFLPIIIRFDMKNSTNFILEVDEAFLGPMTEYLRVGMSHRVIRSYLKYMVDVAVALGANKTNAKTELTESLEFNIRLANIISTSEEKRNLATQHNPMTIEELIKQYPDIPWKRYIHGLFHSDIDLHDITINVSVPKFVSVLTDLLKSTPKRVQANYAIWEIARNSVPYMPRNVRWLQNDFVSAAFGTTESQGWSKCIDDVKRQLNLALGAMYVRNFIKRDVKDNALEMVTRIRETFRKMLENVDWMDEETRNSALEKAENMVNHIAYPDEFLDDKILDGFYENLKIRTDKSFLRANLDIVNFRRVLALKEFRRGHFNKTIWHEHGIASTVNAVYTHHENSIQFPAGILQGIFFHPDRPKYLNYGTIGYVIGHEITHGFDDQGRHFDKDGNLINWWNPDTSSKYLKKAKCIVDQYTGHLINGRITQGENIADNGGIKIAYHAYDDWTRRNGNEPQLPGLNFTNQQMFWISSANVWCSKTRPGLIVVDDFHSPSRIRTNVVLSNMEEFSRDFQCSPGSNMNPKHKCSVW